MFFVTNDATTERREKDLTSFVTRAVYEFEGELRAEYVVMFAALGLYYAAPVRVLCIVELSPVNNVLPTYR